MSNATSEQSETQPQPELQPQPKPVEEVQWVENMNSDDISDILGFDLSSQEGDDRSGLRALINSALVSHRRLPMLDVIFDRTARLMTTNMRQLTNDNVEVTLDDISSTRFGDFLQSISGPSIIGVVKSPTLDNYCLIAVDSQLVYSVVDLLLGGRRSGSALALEDRGFTQIELALIQRVMMQLIDDLGAAFAPVAEVNFSLDRIETTPRFAAIAQEANVCSLAKFRVDMEDRGGRVAILMPHATLEPIYKLLLREFIGEANANEAAWRDHLAAGLDAATLDLKVVLAEREMALGEIGDLAPGQTIKFNANTKTIAEIRAGETVVARGAIGRSGEYIAVRLTSDASPSEKTTEEAA